MQKLWICVVICVAAAMSSIPVLAAPGNEQPDQAAAVITVGEVIGADVLNIHGEKVAEIREARVDLESGRVAWVVVTSTNVLEIDETTYAVPWPAIDFSAGDGTVRLNVDPSKLMAVSQRLYYMTDADFARAVDDYYGLSPAYTWD